MECVCACVSMCVSVGGWWIVASHMFSGGPGNAVLFRPSGAGIRWFTLVMFGVLEVSESGSAICKACTLTPASPSVPYSLDQEVTSRCVQGFLLGLP